MNNPTGKKHIHLATGKTTQTEVYAYTYDHAGRLTKETHQLNGGTLVNLAENTYDELGRLKTNMKGGRSTFTSTYAYNIRAWIKSIAGLLFTQTLYYNESYGGSPKLYSGNISAMSWKLPSETNTRGYAYTYDNLSRLTAANYLENAVANANYKTSYNYDKMGNIVTLQRYGKTMATTYGLIDNIAANTITYTGNQLLKVEDAIPVISLAESADFKNYSNTTPEYVYNTNGAITKDLNKGISDIQYNSLNLPRLMDIKSPVAEARNEYTYSAAGQKLKLVQKWNPNYSTAPVIGSAINVSLLTQSKTTDYIGNMIYENDALKRILIDGGYIEGGVYNYFMTDQQGNNGGVYANGMVIQSLYYYPFGMAFAETSIAVQGKQPYKYNGKELDMMNGLNQYDYGARYYDPAIARFATMDPLAEKHPNISPYVYCANNPVNLVDPTGMDWYWDKDKTRQYDPNIKSQDDLKKGQTYIGATDQVKDKKGNVTEDYRDDGSIMFSNEASGYRRIWNNSQKTEKEEMGVITDKGVLVLPSYKNTFNDSSPDKYGYSFSKGNIKDADGNSFNTLGTVHTHTTLLEANGQVLHAMMGPSGEDITSFGRETPGTPFFVITPDMRIHSQLPVNANLAKDIGMPIVSQIPFTFNSLMFGKYPLINVLKSNRR